MFHFQDLIYEKESLEGENGNFGKLGQKVKMAEIQDGRHVILL